MPDTLANVVLTENVWVDLYAASGLAVGTKLRVQNIGGSNIKLHTSAAAPTSGAGYVIIQPMENYMNYAEDSGAWALSLTGFGHLNVSEAL